MVDKHSTNGRVIKLENDFSVYYSAGLVLLLTAIVLIFSFQLLIILTSCCAIGYSLTYFVQKHSKEISPFLLSILNDLGYSVKIPTEAISDTLKYVCNVCGGNSCSRHGVRREDPWTGLYMHKQLDQAIEDFYSIILTRFVSGWYSEITIQQTGLLELRVLLRYASSSLLKRGLKVNVGKLITSKLIPCGLKHYADCMQARRLLEEKHLKNSEKTDLRDMEKKGLQDLEQAAFHGPVKSSMHPALANRDAELQYLTCITELIMPYLLPKEVVQNGGFASLIKELFAGWVLLSLTDVLADPAIINMLVILATNDEKMSQLPELPDHQVEFLANFIDKIKYKPRGLLKISLNKIIKNPEYLYAYMQYLKSIDKIHLLQFCLDIDEFSKKILQPDLSSKQQVALFESARSMYLMYFEHDSACYIPFARENVQQLKNILDEGVSQITKLQTSAALFQAYEYVFSLLDQHYTPRFLHNTEFHKVSMGARVSSDADSKDPNRKLGKDDSLSKLTKPLTKIKNSLKTQAIESQLLESTLDGPLRMGECDSLDGSEMELQFSDILANYTRLKERDLTTWRISLEDISETKVSSRSSVLHRFCICVHKIDPHKLLPESRWTVERTDLDFAALRSKLIEFHGELEMLDTNIPSKKTKAAEIRKKKYEVFLQNLLMKPILRSSDLLYLFLTASEDFSSLAEQARPGFVIVPDFNSIYQTMAHRWRKEKGQHLDSSFMTTFLISTNVDYYKTSKDELLLDSGEEATDTEVSSTVDNRNPYETMKERYMKGVFGNNCDMNKEIPISLSTDERRSKVSGSCDSLLFMCQEVFKVRSLLITILTRVFNMGKEYFDNCFNDILNALLCHVLSPPRLAYLINLGKAFLFEDYLPSTRFSDLGERRTAAKSQLLQSFPYAFIKLTGDNFLCGVDNLFEILQNPLLNKQLIYNLLDIILVELFPELT